MKIWNRLQCRWVPWHGTRAAWLALPHAVVGTACVLGAALTLTKHPFPLAPLQDRTPHVSADAPKQIAMRILPDGGVSNMPPYIAPQGLTDQIPKSAIVSQPVPPFIPSGDNGPSPIIPTAPNSPPPGGHTGGVPSRSPSPVNVPEPSSLLVLGTAIIGLLGARSARAISGGRRGFHADRRLIRPT
jgi:hypothetical protein